MFQEKLVTAHASVRTQVVNNAAGEDSGGFANGATRPRVFVSAARVPVVLPSDVGFTGNMVGAGSFDRTR